jgi:hypothetical protein
MNNEKYVFAQLISFLNEDKFRRIVNKYQEKTSLTKLIFNMTKNDATLMSQVYLIFNNGPILMGH